MDVYSQIGDTIRTMIQQRKTNGNRTEGVATFADANEEAADLEGRRGGTGAPVGPWRR